VIRSRRGRFLAIPAETVQRRGTDGKRINPHLPGARRFGPFRFVPGRKALSRPASFYKERKRSQTVGSAPWASG
jgi:hypothetical protein